MSAAAMRRKQRPRKKLIWSFQGKPADNSARCLHCHSSGHDQSLFGRSQHKLVGVSCEHCHSAHLLVSSAQNRRKTQARASAFLSGSYSPRRDAMVERKPSEKESSRSFALVAM